MEQAPINNRAIRRSKQQLPDLIAEFNKTGGTTVRAFCKQHNLSEGSFYLARKRYGASATEKKQPSGFIAIKPPSFNQSSGALFAEVKGIKFY